MNSRQKGARGEREAAAAWVAAVGGSARRGQQFAGGTDSPDVVTSHGKLHLEVKRTERGNPYVWMEQAVRDSGGKIPLVLHKRNRQDWLVIVRLDDVAGLAKEIGASAEAVGHGAVPPALPGQGLSATDEPDGQAPGVL
jgi:hypothetical protein